LQEVIMSESSAPGWRTSMMVHGYTLTQRAAPGPTAPSVPVVAGLIETATGDVQFAMRIGQDGDPVILSLQAASQHITHVRELLLDRLRLTGELLGGDET
jgi:hypothetical protein